MNPAPPPLTPGPSEPISTATPPPRRSFTAFDVLVGHDGLRAIWGIILFVALREVLQSFIYPLLQSMFPLPSAEAGPMQPQFLLVYESAALLCILIATLFMAKIERRPIAAYGFGVRRDIRNFGSGLVWGVALLSLLVLILRATGLLVFDARLLFGSCILHYGAIWLAGFLLVGLAEECLFRGYLQFTLTRAIDNILRWFGAPESNTSGFWIAAVLLSFGFGWKHQTNPGESPIGMLAAGLIGVVFCLSLWRTGSLWWAIGFHAAWDWAQSFLYGVADSGSVMQGRLFATHPVGRPILSGGLTGPEGSIYILPVLFVMVFIVILTLPANRFSYSPVSAHEAPLD